MENYAPEKALQTIEPENETIPFDEPQTIRKDKTILQKDLEEVKSLLEILVSKL
jgi:hypothetical protein